MSSRHTHIAMNSMRAYLLGRIDSSEADAFEEVYFGDRKVLLKLKACEDDLLVDYLENRLSPGDRVLFERRYLSVPELRRRLDEARRRGTAAPVWARRGTTWRDGIRHFISFCGCWRVGAPPQPPGGRRTATQTSCSALDACIDCYAGRRCC